MVTADRQDQRHPSMPVGELGMLLANFEAVATSDRCTTVMKSNVLVGAKVELALRERQARQLLTVPSKPWTHRLKTRAWLRQPATFSGGFTVVGVTLQDLRNKGWSSTLMLFQSSSCSYVQNTDAYQHSRACRFSSGCTWAPYCSQLLVNIPSLCCSCLNLNFGPE